MYRSLRSKPMKNSDICVEKIQNVNEISLRLENEEISIKNNTTEENGTQTENNSQLNKCESKESMNGRSNVIRSEKDLSQAHIGKKRMSHVQPYRQGFDRLKRSIKEDQLKNTVKVRDSRISKNTPQVSKKIFSQKNSK